MHFISWVILITMQLYKYPFRMKKKDKSNYRLGQALRVPEVEAARTSRQPAHEGGKAVTPTHRSPLSPPLPPGNTPGTHFCCRLSFQGCSAAGSIKSITNPNDLFGNRTRYLPARSPQQTAPPHTRTENRSGK